MKKILVAGGAGYIGSHLMQSLFTAAITIPRTAPTYVITPLLRVFAAHSCWRRWRYAEDQRVMSAASNGRKHVTNRH